MLLEKKQAQGISSLVRCSNRLSIFFLSIEHCTFTGLRIQSFFREARSEAKISATTGDLRDKRNNETTHHFQFFMEYQVPKRRKRATGNGAKMYLGRIQDKTRQMQAHLGDIEKTLIPRIVPMGSNGSMNPTPWGFVGSSVPRTNETNSPISHKYILVGK